MLADCGIVVERFSMPAPVWGFAAAAYLPPAPEPYWEGINVAVIVNALRG